MTTTTETDKWATFRVRGEMFALRVEDVQEVMMAQPLTPVPLAPEHIVGLLNLRGQVMPAIDLRRRLDMDARAVDQESAMIVLKSHGELASLVVDEIGDVLELPTEGWVAPPETVAVVHRQVLVGICPIEGHLVLGLDVAALLAEPDHVPVPAGRKAT